MRGTLRQRQQRTALWRVEVTRRHGVSCACAVQVDDSCSTCSTSSSSKVSIDGLLQLWPRQLEAALWQSPSAHR